MKNEEKVLLTECERKELMRYLDTLTDLNGKGFSCKSEIQEVLTKLHHTGFGFATKEESVFTQLDKKMFREINGSGYTLYDKKYHGKLIHFNEKDRETMGKHLDEVLVRNALRDNITIVVGINARVERLKQLDEAVSVITMLNIEGRTIPNGVLIDDTVKLDQVQKLKSLGFCIRGGFYYNTDLV